MDRFHGAQNVAVDSMRTFFAILAPNARNRNRFHAIARDLGTVRKKSA